MTAHYIPDTLIYKGEEYVIFDDMVLFSSYLEQHQIELPKDMWTRRGYVAKWEIRENMLFLIELLALDSINLTFMIDKGHIVEEKYQTHKEWYMSR